MYANGLCFSSCFPRLKPVSPCLATHEREPTVETSRARHTRKKGMLRRAVLQTRGLTSRAKTEPKTTTTLGALGSGDEVQD